MSTQKPIRVAVGSDQAIYRRGLSSLLMSLKGIQMVGEAQNEEEAAQLSEMLQPDIFLLDFKIPMQNGRDLAAAIHSKAPGTQTILLLSSQQECDCQDEFVPEGSFYFSKDVSEEELAAALLRLGEEGSPAGTALPRDGDSVPTSIEFTYSAQTLLLPQTPEQKGKSIARELHMAGQVQAGILPEKPPRIPGWDIAAKLESARETSGDFYDFIPLANDCWGFLVADVTDKGMGAALFMALSDTLIRTFAVRYPTLPALAFDLVNERILTDTRGSMFVTAFYAVLEPHTGRMRFVNAGHPPAYLLSTQKGKPVDRLRPTGMALGMIEKAHWGQKLVRLLPGDVLVLYTDGVTEAQSQDGRFFGEEGLMDVLRTVSHLPARGIQEALIDAVRKFCGDSARQDDIALVVIRRTA